MKVLYLTDRYCWDEFGVKRSLYEELSKSVKVELCFFHEEHPDAQFGSKMQRLGEGELFTKALEGGCSHVFFASSGLSFELPLMEKLRERKVLVGFGFSDPRFVAFARQHWRYFHHYFTLSPRIRDEAQRAGISAHVMFPSIHPGFHDRFHVDPDRAEYDVIFMGDLQTHPDAHIRRAVLQSLSEAGLRICTIGSGGTLGHVTGEDLVRRLARGRIGLNIMQPGSTLPHRLFEYAAVGLCVVTTVTPDIADAFVVGEEIVAYAPDSIRELLRDTTRCAAIGERGYWRCLHSHTISNRVSDILDVLGGPAQTQGCRRQSGTPGRRAHVSKVSVIIPTFNCEDLLPRAVESALNQDYRDLEVIVIDDGSTDETEHLVELYAGDPRFRYLKQENLGPGAARNLGLRESTGNYVTFLDSDDYLAPQMISRLAAVLDADENLDLVYCNLVHVEVEDRESFDYDVGKTRAVPSGDILPALLLGGYFPVHSVLVRRSAVERAGGFDEDRKLVEDYDLWLRIAATGGRAHYLDERLAYYQRRSGSRSKEPDQTPEATLCKLMRLYPDQCGHALARLQQECLESWRALRRARDESAASARDLRRDLLQCRRDCERYRKGLEIVMNKPPVRVYRALKCALARLFGRRPSDGSQSEVPR